MQLFVIQAWSRGSASYPLVTRRARPYILSAIHYLFALNTHLSTHYNILNSERSNLGVTMADGLGIAGGVIAVIQLTAKVASLSYHYISGSSGLQITF